MKEKMFNVGKIVNTHGIRGEVKVVRISDFEERFNPGETVFIVKETGEKVKLVIDQHRFHKGFDLLHFKGYDNINDVESFKGTYLKIDESQLTELEENEFYYHEIIGCEVVTTKGEQVGVVKEILSPGANDVWVVKRNQGKDILIPYIEDVVKHVDINEKKLLLNLWKDC